MKLSLTASRCYTTQFRNFFVLVTLNVVQYKNLSSPWWECIDRRRQVHPVSKPRRSCRGCEDVFSTILFIFLFLHAPAASSLIFPIRQHDVHCNSVNPCRERAVTSELRKLFPRPHEHILRQLFTANLASTHPRAKRENPIHVCGVETLECASVTRRRESDVP